MKAIHEQNYYELLEIAPGASQEEILHAYNRARATYGHNSPALYSLFNKEEAQELLRLIDEAYAVLSNQFKRKNYDQSHELRYQTENIVAEGPGFAAGIRQSAPAETFIEDLAVPNAATTAITESQPAKEPIPFRSQASGETVHGKTRFGHFQVDPNMDSEIKNIEIFTGETLKKIRHYKNISIEQISDSTKISRTYLHAIENNDFKVLPAKVFTRGFVVQLAKMLELPEDKVAQSYLSQLQNER